MLKLQKKLKNDYGLVFNDEDLLKTAFTHSSFTNEERLQRLQTMNVWNFWETLPYLWLFLIIFIGLILRN